MLAACAQPDGITSPSSESLGVSLAKAPPSSTTYNPTEIAPIGSDQESIAWWVNNSGTVAVQSLYLPPGGGLRVAHWFVKTGSVTHPIDNVFGINSSTPTQVIGFTNNEIVKWTYTTSTGFSSPTSIGPGFPRAINDLGDITGSTGGSNSDAIIWNNDGSVLTISNPNPSLFARGEGRDISNSGDVALTFWGVTGSPDRGYLRTADGTLMSFSPLAGHRSTYAYGVSDRINGNIYVAGISDNDNGGFNAVRWTVDAATHAVIATEVGSASSASIAMSDSGTISGNIYTTNTSAFVWKRGEGLTLLKTPKGLNNGRVWGMSGDGRYIAGDAVASTKRRAILWTAQ